MLLTGCSVIKWLFGAIKLPLVSCDGGGVLLFNVNRLFCFWLSWIKNESGDWKIIPPEWHSTEAASWNRQWVERTFAVLGSWCFYGSCIREHVCVRLLLHGGRRPNRQVGTRLSSPGFYYLGITFLLFIFYKENLFKLKHNEKYFPWAQFYLHYRCTGVSSQLTNKTTDSKVQEGQDAMFEGKTTYLITHWPIITNVSIQLPPS